MKNSAGLPLGLAMGQNGTKLVNMTSKLSSVAKGKFAKFLPLWLMKIST
jgi:hypothetical protein